MPINNFSVGRDLVLQINTPSGQLRFPLLNSFEAHPSVSDDKRTAMDGVSRHLVFHEGWAGKFSFDRADNNFDSYWAQIESDYYNGITSGTATITETISEANGSVSQYLFSGVVLKPTGMGEWVGNKTVPMTIDFMATRRYKLS